MRPSKPSLTGLKLVVGALLLIVVAPAVYVLSMGPTARLVRADSFSLITWHHCYAPIRWTAKHLPGGEDAIATYLNVWGAYPIVGHDSEGRLITIVW